jgi:transcriptional regulator with XRE-family HTH domain
MRDSKGVKGNTMQTQLKKRREALKLSMRAAAKLGGLSPQGWSAVEAGNSPPSLATQRAVATALGWPVDWLEQIQRDGAVTLPEGGTEARDTSHRLAEAERALEELREHVYGLAAELQAWVERLEPPESRPSSQP